VKPVRLLPFTKHLALGMAIILLLLPSAWASRKFKVLHRFYAGNNNGGLYSALTPDAKGDIYGTTWGGGVNAEGTIFELRASDHGQWEKKLLHSFDRRTEGGNPWGTLLFDGDAILYGTTSSANGTVFQMTRSAGHWTFDVISEGDDEPLRERNCSSRLWFPWRSRPRSGRQSLWEYRSRRIR
jgi:hypothetical protein